MVRKIYRNENSLINEVLFFCVNAARFMARKLLA
jgi:hypothetical protein